jgi:phage baseplate assembly protein W
MPTEMLYPFAIGPDGSIASTGDPDKQIRQHVLTLINTEPGERAVRAEYGVPTQELLFAPDDALVAESIATKAKTALGRYEPGVVLQSVVPVVNPEGSGIAQVTVNYIRRESATSSSSLSRNTNTAVIEVGGHVNEVVRG